jgi:hypothetical protein
MPMSYDQLKDRYNCNCLLDYDFVLHIVNFAILYTKYKFFIM